MSKKKINSRKIKTISKLIAEGKLNKALELADVTDVEYLFDIGLRFGRKNIYLVAEKIFDRVIQLNPNYAEAWSNKGVV